MVCDLCVYVDSSVTIQYTQLNRPFLTSNSQYPAFPGLNVRGVGPNAPMALIGLMHLAHPRGVPDAYKPQ